MSSKINFKLIDVFTSSININVDVKKIASFLNEQSETKVTVLFFISSSIIKKSDNNVLFDFKIEGKAEDKRFNFSGIITGLFEFPNQLSSNNKRKTLQPILSQLARELWPYVRELAVDISKRLPSEMIIRLPVDFPDNIVDIQPQNQENN